MNKLIFNTGGQPVFLDDLGMIQDNASEAMRLFVRGVCGGVKAFMVDRPALELQGNAGTVYKLGAGTLVVDGEPMDWQETVLNVPLPEQKIYLWVKRTETGRRVFEDGQSRNCVVSSSVTVSLEADTAGECYVYQELPTFAEVVKDYLGKTGRLWTKVDARFFNDYSGIVAYKELDDCYRVKIDITSTSMKEIPGDSLLFYSDVPFLQAFSSSTQAYVESENGGFSFTVSGFEGQVHADVSLPQDDVSMLSSLPVKMIFEIPK